MSDSFDLFYSLFHIQYSKAGNCYLSGINNNQTFIFKIFDSPLEEKFNFSIPWDLNKKAHSVINLQNKVTFRASKLYLNETILIYCRETAWIFDLMLRHRIGLIIYIIF